MKDKTIHAILDSINNNNPISRIYEKEFNEQLLRFGAFVSIIRNKKINQTMLLLSLLDNPHLREIFKQLTSIQEDQILITELIYRYPILCKSKIIRNKIIVYYNQTKTT